jgi:hypothetical protein
MVLPAIGVFLTRVVVFWRKHENDDFRTTTFEPLRRNVDIPLRSLFEDVVAKDLHLKCVDH